MTDQQAAAPKRPKGRSPSYPAIDLDDAIKRVEQLYRLEKQHPTPVQALAKHWGYRSLNGPASLTLAALKKFGLLEDEGTGPNRVVRVSDLAVEILEHPDDRRRRAAIDVAALNPSIHQEMWDRYGSDLPSDANLRWTLTRDRGFTETGADEFIPEYRSTLAFAHLYGTGTLGTQTGQMPIMGGEQEQDEEDDEIEQPSAIRQPRGERRRRVSATTVESDTYYVPIAAGINVAVEGPFPLTEAQWQQFQAVLNAMKPALVSDDPPEDVEDEVVRGPWEP